MNRIDRLHAILTVLQSKRIVRAEDLAIRFDISIRTVYRDLKALEESGVPIGAEAGVGYFLIEGYHLPPVMFTYDEARALLLAGMFLDKYSDAATREHFQYALTKVRAILDVDKKDDLEGLEQKIVIMPYSYNRPEPEDLRLTTIKQALSNNNVLEIVYTTIQSDSTSRVIEPIGLCFYGEYWHLIAWCTLRNDFRDFRLDRITDLRMLTERFKRIKHPSLKEYLAKLAREQQLIPVTIRVHQSIIPYISNAKYNMGLLEELREDDWTQMTFSTFNLEYFARWLMMLGTSCLIISPESLKEKAKELSIKLFETYK